MSDQVGATYPVGTIAKLLDVTDRRVQQLAAQGVFPKAESGRYMLVPRVRGYIKYLRDRAIGADLPGDATIGAHKGRLIKARADIAEIEAEVRSGTMVPAAEVESSWVAIVGRFRQHILAIPSKAAPLVAVESEPDACHAIVEGFIHEALAELAATEVQLGGKPDASGNGRVRRRGAAAEADGERVGGHLQEAQPGE